jgi:hypothetical protein
VRSLSALVAGFVLTAYLVSAAPPVGASPQDAPSVGFVGDSVVLQAFREIGPALRRDREIAFHGAGLGYKIRDVLPAVRRTVRGVGGPDIFLVFIGTAQSEVDPPSVWRRELRQLLDEVSPRVDCVRVFEIDDNDTGYYLLHDRNARAYNRITHAVTDEYPNAEWYHYALWADRAGADYERPDQLHHNRAGQLQIARLMQHAANSCDPALTSGPFWDVPDAYPAAEAIAFVGQQHLFGGYANGTYRAQIGTFVLPATRGGLLNMAWKLAGRPDGYAPHPWRDGRRALDVALNWAAATRVGTGYPDGTYRPDAVVTRGQALALLWRIAGRPGGFPDDPWTDADDPAIRWAAAHHLLGGATATTFAPEDRLTRAQMATLLFRFATLAPAAATPPSTPSPTGTPATTSPTPTTPAPTPTTTEEP